MLKRILKTSGTIFLILIVLYACARLLDKSLGGIYDGERTPYLQVDTPSSIVIQWQTTKPNVGVVRIGKSITQRDQVFSEASEDDEHSLRITGLEPNTKYFYSVGTAKYLIYEGAAYWFKTTPADKVSAIRFWVTGDQGEAGVTQNTVRDAMLSWTKQHARQKVADSEPDSNLDFWLTTGDNAYTSGTNQQFQDNFFTPYSDILKHTPVWPGYGNHDSRRWTFFSIFNFPTQAEAGGVASATEKYYSFDYAALHVVMLDTQSSRMQKNSRMLRWLKKDLAATKQKWLVAVFHHPPYSKGTHNSDNPADSHGRMQNLRRYVLPILEKAGVDVVLSGHSHMYERSWFMNCHYGVSNIFSDHFIQDRQPGAAAANKKQQGMVYRKAQSGLSSLSGTIYITLGSSAKLDSGEINHPAMPVSLHESGSLIFDISGDKLSASFITKSGKVADNFTIEKGVKDAPKARGQCK